MTSKEKAKELFDKMYNVDDPMGNYPMCFDTAKQCALIAVDEILNFMNALYVVKGSVAHQCWIDVKSEIEKI